ncbi:MAG: hypothetical protein JO366_04355 [Methylobacteriaceae bacterium]|nr:hypothetical protein [Methylobacteriaceae bacterium]
MSDDRSFYGADRLVAAADGAAHCLFERMCRHQTMNELGIVLDKVGLGQATDSMDRRAAVMADSDCEDEWRLSVDTSGRRPKGYFVQDETARRL